MLIELCVFSVASAEDMVINKPHEYTYETEEDWEDGKCCLIY